MNANIIVKYNIKQIIYIIIDFAYNKIQINILLKIYVIKFIKIVYNVL